MDHNNAGTNIWLLWNVLDSDNRNQIPILAFGYELQETEVFDRRCGEDTEMKDKDLLVGSTGFVGGNLMASHSFARVCHSSDIHEYFGANPDLCVYSGVPAAMFLANSNSEADLEIMRHAIENIRKINPQKFV